MKEVVLYGRGGMGVKAASQILAIALFYDGYDIRAFPEYGPERRGAPVKAFVRFSKSKIKTYEPIEYADYLLIFDESLFDLGLMKRLKRGGKVLINGVRAKMRSNIYVVDASSISLKLCGKNFPNIVLLGAFSKLFQCVSLSSLKKAIEEVFKVKGEDIVSLNKKLLQAGYDYFTSRKEV